MTELLKQPQFQPIPVRTGRIDLRRNAGFLDAVEVKDVVRYEARMLSYLRADKPEVLAKIRATPRRSTRSGGRAQDALTTFGKQFRVG